MKYYISHETLTKYDWISLLFMYINISIYSPDVINKSIDKNQSINTRFE